jgi:hypothetical protein
MNGPSVGFRPFMQDLYSVAVSLWGCESESVSLWGCESESVRLWVCEAVSLWGCESAQMLFNFDRMTNRQWRESGRGLFQNTVPKQSTHADTIEGNFLSGVKYHITNR